MFLFNLTVITTILTVIFIVYNIIVVLKVPKCCCSIQSTAVTVRQNANVITIQKYAAITCFYLLMLFVLLILVNSGFLSVFVLFAFITGGIFSFFVKIIGVKLITLASSRTIMAAQSSLNKGFHVAFSSGSVVGFAVVGLGLVYLTVWYFLLKYVFILPIEEIASTMLTFGIGITCTTLIVRVFFRSKNAIKISDLYESYIIAIITASYLGVSAFSNIDAVTGEQAFIFPMIIANIGILATMVFSIILRLCNKNITPKTLLAVMQRNVVFSIIVITISAFPLVWIFMGNEFIKIYGTVLLGSFVGIGLIFFTKRHFANYYRLNYDLKNIINKESVKQTADNVISRLINLSVPLALVSGSVLLSFYISGGNSNTGIGLFGIAVFSVSLLSTLGLILTNDTFCSIAENASDIAEMAEVDSDARHHINILNFLGNTTAVIDKGFAVCAGALTAILLTASYFIKINELSYTFNPAFDFNLYLYNPSVLFGLLIGFALPFIFSSVIIKYENRKDMFFTIILAAAAPIIIGLFLGPNGIISLLVGCIICTVGAFWMIIIANSRGAWVKMKNMETVNLNSDKLDDQRAAVISHALNDPFRNTYGQFICIFLKLNPIVSIVFAGFVLAFS